MYKILGRGFEVTVRDNNFCLQNKHDIRIWEPITYYEAIVLSLLDGKHNDDEITAFIETLIDKVPLFIGMYEKTLQKFHRYIILSDKGCGEQEGLASLVNKFDLSKITQYKSRLLRRMMPIHVMWLVTNKCTRRCVYCYLSGKLNMENEQDCLTFEEVEQLAIQCEEACVEQVTLSGGDPLMRKDIYEICNLFTSRGMSVGIITKMRLNEDKIHYLDPVLVNIQFSLDSHIAQAADKLAGFEGHLSDMYYNFSLCNLKGISFNIAVTVNKANKDTLCETIDKFMEVCPKSIIMNKYNTEFQKINHDLLISDEDYNTFAKQAEIYFKSQGYGNNVVINKRKPISMNNSCDSGRSKIVFDYCGRVVICEKSITEPFLGSLRRQTLIDIWYSKNYVEACVNPPKEYFQGTICKECDEFDSCTSKTACIVRSYLRTGNYYQPLEEITNQCSHSLSI